MEEKDLRENLARVIYHTAPERWKRVKDETYQYIAVKIAAASGSEENAAGGESV